MKTCFKCRIEKPLDAFYKHPQMADGHLNKCKDCTRADVAANYRDHRTQYAEYEKRRFQKNERKNAALEYMRKLRERHPDKYAAWSAVRNALRAGHLSKCPCEICGKDKVEAHHDDYSKPLDVRWLCRKHHLAVHGKTAF